MTFEIFYQEEVAKKDIPALPRDWQKKIKQAIEEKLGASPEIFGKPLRKSLKGYRKLRIGDFRVVFRIEENNVKIFAILHRSVVYKTAAKRIL